MRCLIPDRDLHQKLHGTYCRYKGVPVYVHVEGSQILIYDLPKLNKPTQIKKEDENFDISSIPLGYCNSTKQQICVYLSRVPFRRVKQGVTQSNVRILPLPDDKQNKPSFGISQWLGSQGFVDLVMDKYPSVEDGLKILRTSFKRDPFATCQIAVTRNIAMRIDANGIIHVYYKNDLVGWMKPDSDIVHISSSDKAWVISKYLSHVLGWKVD